MSVRHAILGLVAQEPRHGYALVDAFHALVGGRDNWDVKPPQFYATLTRLKDSGLIEEAAVEQDAGPEKRVWRITLAGAGELERWLVSAVPDEHVRDELFLKLMLAIARDDGQPYVLLRTQRALLYQELHDLQARRSRLDPHTRLAQMLLLDKAVMHLEADLRWIDMIEVRLEDVAGQPPALPEARRRGRPPKTATAGPDERAP